MMNNTNSSMRLIVEQLEKTEDLHPELQRYLFASRIGTSLKHPLVFDILYSPKMNALLNQQYKAKSEAAAAALKIKNWSHFVCLHERPWRLQAFQTINRKLDHQTYWEMLAGIWTDSENIWQNLQTWKRLFRSLRGQKHCFMTPEDRATLESLPSTITIHRGYVPGKNKDGISFSLSEERAVWFSKRFSENGMVKTLTVKKEDVFAYMNVRSEQEIILLPKKAK
jgi:hypothetical protein